MEFLDLTNASDSERKEIEDILSKISNGVELPFDLVGLCEKLKLNPSDKSSSIPDVVKGNLKEDKNVVTGVGHYASVESGVRGAPVLISGTSAAYNHPSGYGEGNSVSNTPSHSSSSLLPAVYEPKAHAIIPADTYKTFYPNFVHGTPVGPYKRVDGGMGPPDPKQVSYYAAGPAQYPHVITTMPVGGEAMVANASMGRIPSRKDQNISGGNNEEGVDGGVRLPSVSGTAGQGPHYQGIQPQFHPHPGPYPPPNFIPGPGAPLPVPPHMFPMYYQIIPPYYTPIPHQVPDSMGSQEQQNRTLAGAGYQHMNANNNPTTTTINISANSNNDNIVNNSTLVTVNKGEEKEGGERMLSKYQSEVTGDGSEATEVTPHSCSVQVTSKGNDSEKEGPSIGMIIVNNNGPVNEGYSVDKMESENDKKEDACKDVPVDKGKGEEVASPENGPSGSEEKDGKDSGAGGAHRSWADLFKGREPTNTPVYYSNTGSSPPPFSAPLSQPLPSSFISSMSQDQNEELYGSGSVNDKLIDAQVNSIPLHEDSMAKKLGKRLKDIHLKHSLPFLVPRGFVNRGNWCYINATLQALLYCPPFYNLMREIGEIHGIFRQKSSTPIIDSFARFFTNFLPSEPMMKKAKAGSFNPEDMPKGDPFEPKCIYEVLGVIKSECLKGRQEDAEEFLSSVLNGLHDEMFKLIKNLNNINKPVNGDAINGHINDEGDGKKMKIDDQNNDDDDDSHLWKEVGHRHKALPTRSAKVLETPILDIFGGSVLSVRTAGKDVCGNRQPFFSLQLDIQSDKIKSVEDALKYLTSSESLQGYTCPKTKQAIDASHQSFLDQLPPILILHLKLFIYDKDGGSKKLIKKIDYPIDLELPKDCLHHHDRGGDKNRYSKSYKLLSVVHHDGSESMKGHYITDIYHIGSSLWLRCDDNTIKPITVQQLLSPQPPRTPYILFYRRCDTLRGRDGYQRGPPPVNHS